LDYNHKRSSEADSLFFSPMGLSEISAADGLDPRLERRKSQPRSGKNKANHSALRLDGQIAKCIRASLGDGLLANFDVVGIEPAQGNNFLVTLGPALPDLDYDPSQVVLVANDREGYLRSEIACSINRKRVPNLTFRVLTHTYTPNR
jgi:ribosome-binding factor A